MDELDRALERRRRPRPQSGGSRRPATRREAECELSPEAVAALAHVFGGHELRAEELTRAQAAELVELAIETLCERLSAHDLPQAEVLRLADAARLLVATGRDLNARGLHEHRRVLSAVHAALADLRGLFDADQVVRRGLASLAPIGDFDRVLLFRVNGDYVVAHQAEIPGQPEIAAELVATSVARSPTGATADALRRRSAVLVRAGAEDPGSALAGADEYVVTPLVPTGQPIALLYTDRALTGRPMDALDRDMVWTFAEGFGCALARSALQGRLDAQRRYFRQLALSGEAVMTELTDTPLAIAPETHDEASLHIVLPRPESASAEGRSLLTPRELEIMELLAQGARNRVMAQRLYLSEETIKSHVGRILKKLGAANRTEAVSRFLAARH